MRFTSLAINNNRVTFSLIFVVLFMGMLIFTQMPRDDMPPFLIRFATVVSVFPGASPERVEMLVTDKIEKVIQEIPEVDYIESESRTGISIVVIAIKESETELRPIFDNIRRKVEGIRDQMPAGVSPVVNDELGDVFGIIVGLTGEGFSYAELREVADDIRDGLIKIPDAAKVEIAGAQEERIFIEYDNATIANLGLTQQMLMNILSGTNIIFPGGDIKVGNERIILEPTGSFENIDDLKNVIISDAGGQMVYLGDITSIRRGYVEPQKAIVRINGQPGMALAISVKQGGNIVKLGEEVNKAIEEYQAIYPIGIELQRIASQDEVVQESVMDFIGNLLQTVTVVLVVMLLFLGVRTGMVVASLIPTVIIMTIFIISNLNIGLNQVSLVSLIIALGMLVDNAIVMSESIMVKMGKGEKPLDAALSSTRELSLPLLSASLTTSAAFLAFFLAESVMGEIMGQLFVVVTVALLSSWLLAMTMIPMLCIYFIKIKKKRESETGRAGLFDRFNVQYSKLLYASLRRPYILVTSIVILFFLAMFGFGKLPFIFFPDSERAIVSANIELPLGTDIKRTEQVIAEIEDFIRDSLLVNDRRTEGIMNWSSYIGEGAPKYDLGYMPPEASPNAAHILMNTSSGEINQYIIDNVYSFCFENYPEMLATVGRLGQGGAASVPIAIRISGKDPEILYQLSSEVKECLNGIPGTKNVDDNWGMRNKKLIINIDQTRAKLAGVSSHDIAISLQTVLAGSYIGQFREGDKVIPIIMRNQQTEAHDIDKLESLNIYAQYTGMNVPLKQVADASIIWEASKILRRDLHRTITVTSEVKDGYTANEIMQKLVPTVDRNSESWPTGYRYIPGGEAEESAEAMDAVNEKLPISLFIILLLLIGQFNSIRKSTIVLLTIPLGLIGVVAGLMLARSSFGFMAFMGLISLAGIIINNAIVLLDRIKIEREEFKRPPQEAIIMAARQRFRPILLTTATTSLGLIPLWIGGGIMWRPMAITIIFGLLFATIITLLFVPVLYKSFFRISFRDYQRPGE
jgi:multidrug efflux pump subunit AcrB